MILKNSKFYKKFKIINRLHLILFSFVFSNNFAQTQQNQTLYIGDNGVVSVVSGSYNFGPSPAVTLTTRTNNVYGKLFFGAGTSWNNASTNHFVNGYSSSIGNSSFIFPVGDGSVYAPSKIMNANIVSSYDCAFNSVDPSTIGIFDSSTLEEIADFGYWDLLSVSNAKLSLSWDSYANLGALVPGITLEDIVIAGWNGLQWEQIPSTVDVVSFSGGASDLSSGSITSDLAVNFAVYSKFTIGAKGRCAPIIASSGVTKTWNGTWSPSAPSLEDPVIINTPYNAGSFSCNSLVLNADVTLNADQFVEIINEVTGSGKIVMSSSSSVVQRANGVSAPNIELTKTRQGLRRYDYVYYGTPIVGNFFSDFSTAQATTSTTANAYDLFYKYVSGAGGGWAATSTTETGKGLIARVKQAAPFLDATTTDDVSVIFSGVANNGDVMVTATNNPTAVNGGTSHALLGNPYPSAIDGELFLKENLDIDGVIYIWTSATSYPGSGSYNQADYIAYTLAGFVLPSSIAPSFDGFIPSGQGFKVKLLPDETNPTTVERTANITFNNCMRITDNNSNFYKYASSNLNEEKDRFKVTMTGDNGVYSQILIAYLPESTLGYDRMYDAGTNSVSTAQFYSIFEGDGRKLAINARPQFFDTDVVPVGFLKDNTNNETFVFTLSDKEGIFNTSSVSIYLHDKIANTYHDFNNGSFTYTTNQNIENDRFEIVYQNSVLSNDDFTSATASVVLNNELIKIQSSNIIESVYVYDLSGRIVEKYNSVDSNNLTTSFNHEESIYIVKIIFDNGATSNVKVVNIKN